MGDGMSSVAPAPTGSIDAGAGDRRLKLGVIGAGAWAAFAHIPAFLRRSDVEPWIVNRRDGASSSDGGHLPATCPNWGTR